MESLISTNTSNLTTTEAAFAGGFLGAALVACLIFTILVGWQIINAIEGNQTIVLSSDISAEQDDTSIIIPSETSITINLQGHCINRASTESQNDGSVFIIHSTASLTIFDETKTGRITGGHTKELGGAIYNEGSLVINGVIIEGNTASQGGGLFIEYDAIVEINDSYINMNTADKDGGAIYSHGNITITNSVIHGNICYGGGAGILPLRLHVQRRQDGGHRGLVFRDRILRLCHHRQSVP